MNNNTEMTKQISPKEKEVPPQLLLSRGRTTFMIGLHFRETGGETIKDKTKRLIIRDIHSGAIE